MTKNIKESIKGTDSIIVDGEKRVINDLLLECLPQIKAIVNCNSGIANNLKEDLIQELCIDFITIATYYKDDMYIKFTTFVVYCLKNALTTHLNKISSYNNRTISYEELEDNDKLNDILIKHNSSNFDENIFNIFCDNNKDGEFAKLRYINGYTLEDIARIKGVSRQAVNIRLKNFNEYYKKEWLGV